jgi:protein-L-isoaspartate(D-aspartate) O-methyltransferase
MVRQQVRTWDVFDDETLALLSRLDRHEFVPPGYADLAYAETSIPLPHGQEMMPPLIEGRLLQALDPAAGDRVLEIGSGSGFLTACLASLADTVVSVDIFEDLTRLAAANLDKAGIENVELLTLDAMRELPDGAFDVIAVTGSMSEFDERFMDALAPGGRLFVIVGDAPVMEARLLRLAESGREEEILFETCIKPLVHAARETSFVF